VLAYAMIASIHDSDPAVRLYDPFCGSGTLVIESVFRFMGLPTPPLPRAFAFENWPVHNEYEYNALMREWNNQYDVMVDEYVKKFGVSKYKSLMGEQDTEDMSLDNFPLFIGSDLRAKSIRAAVHNARSARVNYFTQFYKSDFEDIISRASNQWIRYEEEQRAKTLRSDGFDRPAPEPQADGLHRGSHTLLGGPALPPVLSTDDIMRMQGFDVPTDAAPELAPTFHGANDVSLRFPYLKGYTMFANVPWGVSDSKEYMTGAQRKTRPDRYNRGKVNTTQHEPIEDLYERFGATLQRHGHLFRDVFVLSAHHKFEKLTAIGAHRAAILDQRTESRKSNSLMRTNELASYQRTTDLKWEKVTSFYNQGVRTDLLKLQR
jgi:23S rRNA G2445 N2-methylase RlmL